MDLINTVLGIHKMAREAIDDAVGGTPPVVEQQAKGSKAKRIYVVDIGSSYQLINGTWQELPPF
jgi:hypothetical protein